MTHNNHVMCRIRKNGYWGKLFAQCVVTKTADGRVDVDLIGVTGGTLSVTNGDSVTLDFRSIVLDIYGDFEVLVADDRLSFKGVRSCWPMQ